MGSNVQRLLMSCNLLVDRCSDPKTKGKEKEEEKKRNRLPSVQYLFIWDWKHQGFSTLQAERHPRGHAELLCRWRMGQKL